MRSWVTLWVFKVLALVTLGAFRLSVGQRRIRVQKAPVVTRVANTHVDGCSDL